VACSGGSRLPRSSTKIASAGIADYFGWSRTTVRVLAALSVLIPGPQVLAYIVCWILVPDQRKAFA